MRSLVVCLILIAGSAAAEIRWQPRGLVEFGVDRFAQVYRVSELGSGSETFAAFEPTLRDTTEVFTEFRGAAEFGLRIGDRRHGADLRTRLSLGTDTIRGTAETDFEWRGERNRFDTELFFEGRRFRENSDFTLSSDYGEIRSRSHWRHEVRDGWEVGLRARGDLTRYERASPFEVDNERLDVSVTNGFRGGLGQFLDVEAGIGRRWADPYEDPDAPDATTAILSYDRIFGRIDWAYDGGSRVRTSIAHWIERRDYQDESQRSSLWNAVFEPEITLRLDDDWDLRWRTAIEWLDYDTSSSTYYDLALGRTGLALLRRWGPFEASVEPRLGWLSAPEPQEDEFLQPSLVLGFDGFGGDRFFISIQEEIGRRDYREPTATDEFDFYSDYWFLRSTILASVTVARATSLEFFLSDEPESHRSEEDDARLTLVTATVRVSF